MSAHPAELANSGTSILLSKPQGAADVTSAKAEGLSDVGVSQQGRRQKSR